MEMRKGYKQTEVGIIPKDWNTSPLGNIGEVIRGASPRPKGDKRFYGGNVPRLMVEDVTRDGKFVIPQVDFLTEEGAKRSRPCKKGTLTIVCSGTVGIPSFLGVDACIHDGFLALIGISKKVSDDYLYHQLSALREMFENSATHGGVFTNLTTTGVKEFVVPLPPTKSEQEAIAEALSHADALIEAVEQLLTKKRQVKQGAMQELLTGKRRLAGFGGKGYKKTEIGNVPEDWEVVTVKDITASHKQGFYSKENYVDNGTYLVRITDLMNPVINYTDMPKLKVSKRDFDFYKIRKGDFLFARSGSIGRYGIVYENVDAVFGSFIIRFTFNLAKVINEYFGYVYETEIVWKQLLSITQGSSNININANNIKSLKIPLPSLPEQTAIAEILSDMDAEISALEEKLVKARQVKAGMMSELLGGKIRLT